MNLLKLAAFLCCSMLSILVLAQNRPDLSNLNPDIQWGNEIAFSGGASIDYFVGDDDTHIFFVVENYGSFGSSLSVLSSVNKQTLEVKYNRDMSRNKGFKFARAVMMEDKLFGLFYSDSEIRGKHTISVLELDKSTLEPIDSSTENIKNENTFNSDLRGRYEYAISPDGRLMAVILVSGRTRLNDINIAAMVFDENMNIVTNAEYSSNYNGSNYIDHKVDIDNTGNAMVTMQIEGLGAGQNRRDSKAPYGFRTFLFEPGQSAPKEIEVVTNEQFIGSFFTQVSENGSLYFVATYREDHRDNARGFLLSKLEKNGTRFNKINVYPFTDEFLSAISIRGEFLRSRGIDKLIMKNVQFLKDGSFVVGAEQSWTRSSHDRRSGPASIQHLDDDVVLAHFSSDYKMVWCSNISKKQRFYALGIHGSYAYYNVDGKHMVMFNDALRNRDEYRRNKVKYTTNNLVGLFIGLIDDNGNFAKKPAFGEYYDGTTSGVAPRETYLIDNKLFVYQTMGRSFRVCRIAF